MAASTLSSSSSSSAQWSKMMRDNRLKELEKQHLAFVKRDFEKIKEYNSRLGEIVSLQDKYIPLQMKKEYREIKDKEHKILYKGRKRVQEESWHFGHSPMLPTLFDPNDNGHVPQVVVLHGPAGIGKTWTSHKIMLDWASGSLYQGKFGFVFYLSCRELNTVTGKISLVRLLSRTCSLGAADLGFILTDSGNHGKLLFIIDGFDELEWSVEKKPETCHDFCEEIDKETLLRSLLKKEVVKESYLLITTRSMAHDQLSTLIDDPCYFEIIGFQSEDLIKYFLKSFAKEADAEKPFSVIKGNNLLLTMCTCPILCWIMCTVLRQEMKKGLDILQYKTTTSVYLLYLKGLLIHHGQKQPVLPCLKKLCALANEGILKKKILFDKKDLERHGLSVPEVDSVFLNENLFHVSIKSQAYYSFIHLSVQELLAALHFVLDNGDMEEVIEDDSLQEICQVESLPKLCFDHPHLSLAVQFLFGLLYEKELNEFSRSTGCKISLNVRSIAEEWVTSDEARTSLEEWIEMGISSGTFMDAISCLYETQNEDLIRRALPRPKCLKLDGLYWHAEWNKNAEEKLYYCLKLCECPLTLTMQWKKIYSEGREMLFPLLHRCQQLSFDKCYFLKRKRAKPTKAFLADAEEEEEVYSSSDDDDVIVEGDPAGLSWLINPESQIQELGLHDCHLSPLCYDVLRSVIITNRSLTKLDLSRSRLEDCGIKLLCEGLKDPRCNLQDLSLFDCHLSASCCNILCSALVTNRSLTKLDLIWNHVEDSGMKYLCEWLKDPCCSLLELSVQGCHLSPLCCDDLHSAIVKNRRLTKLDISNNPLEDSGVKLVLQAISHPECSLEYLNIWQCRVTPLGCDDLCLALVTNRSLTKLDLTKNHLEDSGVKRLCEALRDPRCVLQDLTLRCCKLTTMCCDDLRSALTTNRSLIKLELTDNKLKDSGVKSLCEGLKAPSCTLQELRLMFCQATVSCLEDLCSVISANQTLTYLETSLDRNDEEMSKEVLNSWCEELERLGCSVGKWGSIDVRYSKKDKESN